MELNKKLLSIFKKVKTTSDEDTYTCSYINDLVEDVYSNNEIKTNKVWINGKPIYRKVINIGNLPNATSETIATGINFNNARLINMFGFCKFDSNNVSLPLPFNNPSNLNDAISINIDNSNNVIVLTGRDRSGYSGYVIIEYTKTTD